MSPQEIAFIENLLILVGLVILAITGMAIKVLIEESNEEDDE